MTEPITNRRGLDRDKLLPKEKVFVKGVLAGKSISSAYKGAYNHNPKSKYAGQIAHIEGKEVLKRPVVQKTLIKKLADKLAKDGGDLDELLASRFISLLEGKNEGVAARMLELAMKLKGELVDRYQSVQQPVDEKVPFTDDQLKEIIGNEN